MARDADGVHEIVYNLNILLLKHKSAFRTYANLNPYSLHTVLIYPSNNTENFSGCLITQTARPVCKLKLYMIHWVDEVHCQNIYAKESIILVFFPLLFSCRSSWHECLKFSCYNLNHFPHLILIIFHIPLHFSWKMKFLSVSSMTPARIMSEF